MRNSQAFCFSCSCFDYSHPVGPDSPVDLALDIANSLVPSDASSKARSLCCQIVVRINLSSEQGSIFRRCLAFFFSQKVIGAEISANAALASGPSLEMVRQSILQLVSLPRTQKDHFWTVRCCIILLLNCVAFGRSELIRVKQQLSDIRKAFEQLNTSIREDGNSPAGLILCKEAALLSAAHVGILQAGFGQNLTHFYPSK